MNLDQEYLGFEFFCGFRYLECQTSQMSITFLEPDLLLKVKSLSVLSAVACLTTFPLASLASLPAFKFLRHVLSPLQAASYLASFSFSASTTSLLMATLSFWVLRPKSMFWRWLLKVGLLSKIMFWRWLLKVGLLSKIMFWRGLLSATMFWRWLLNVGLLSKIKFCMWLLNVGLL